MEATKILADFATTLRYDDLPPEVSRRARSLILDTIGVGVGGAQERSSSLLLQAAGCPKRSGESSLFGYPGKLPRRDAALANGAFAHARELEESHSSAGHPAIAVLPALLAVAETTHASGKDLLAAFVAGYDVHVRIGRGSIVSDMALGWHFTSVCGVFGAAAAVSRLLHLDSAATANALGIAGSLAAGNLLSETDGTFAKRLQPGNAAQGGILAASLAAIGYTGPTDVLEAAKGFYHLYARGHDLDRVVDGLGRRFELLQSNLKIYPCCTLVHPAIDAALQLIQHPAIVPVNIQRIDVRVTTSAFSQACRPLDAKRRPPNPVYAQFSLPYFVALALCRGRVPLDAITRFDCDNPVINELADKVYAEVDPALDDENQHTHSWPTAMTITCQDGATHHAKITHARGSWQNPLSRDLIETKFRQCTTGTLPAPHIQRLIEAVNQLEAVDDVASLAGWFSGRRDRPSRVVTADHRPRPRAATMPAHTQER